jgi:hypothetical protein
MLMTYIVANECCVLVANGLVTVIVLNGLAILMLIYSVLIDEIITIQAKKLQLAFVMANMALIIVTDVAYLTSMLIPLFVWFVMAPFIILIAYLQNDLSIKNELDNINKWTTPADMLKYCSGLRYLISQPDDSLHLMYINGYCDVHRQKCEEATCPIRMTSQALKKLRTFNPVATRNKRN